MTAFTGAPDWAGPSGDPNDEQFGDVVEPTTLEAVDDYDAVLVGEPYDGAVIGRSGASEGPAAIRSALAGAKTHSFGTGPVSGVADLGTVEIPERVTVSEVQAAVREVTAAVHERAVLPVFLGGDNSLTFPNVVPLLDTQSAGEKTTADGPSVGVVSFDAHLDCRAVRGQPTSGTPYRQLFEAGLDRLAVVGARSFETSTAYADYLDDHGGTVLTAQELSANVDDAVARAMDWLSVCDRLYVSVDVDVLDETAAPGVSAPTPGGLSTGDLYRALHHVAPDERICGVEVVECAPPLDPSDRTARAASRAVAHFLAHHL